MGRRQAVRHRILIPAFPGSIPGAPATLNYEIYIELDVALRGVDEKDEVTDFILFTFWLFVVNCSTGYLEGCLLRNSTWQKRTLIMTIISSTELSVDFEFWLPEEGCSLSIVPDEPDLSIPIIPIPILSQDYNAQAQPSEKAIGDGIYAYLCTHPDCDHASEYALILKQAYPFLFSDIAAELLVLDLKDVDHAGTLRKLALLKILLHLEPENFGLLFKIGVVYHDLSLSYADIYQAENNLQQARSFFELARKINTEEPANLNYLGQVCYILGKYHQAKLYWRTALKNTTDQAIVARLSKLIEKVDSGDTPKKPLVDNLKQVAEAVILYDDGLYSDASNILETIEADGQLTAELPNSEFYYFLGLCREKCQNV